MMMAGTEIARNCELPAAASERVIMRAGAAFLLWC